MSIRGILRPKLKNERFLRKVHVRWLNLFINNCEKLNKSPHTLKNYRCDLEKFLLWFENCFHQNITKANATTIETYKDYLSGIPIPKKITLKEFLMYSLRLKNKKDKAYIQTDPLSVSSKRRHLSSVKNFFEFLIQYYQDQGRYFDKNPVKTKLHAIKLKDIDVNHTQLLSATQWYQLEKSIHNPKEKLILALLYYGGLRLAEVTKLRVEDFSMSQKTLTFIRKGGEIHTLKLQEFEYILSLLKKYLANRNYRQEYLFVNRYGQPLSTRSMYTLIKRMLKSCGLTSNNLGPHSFRKACATNMYFQTKDILLVRNYLNHKDAKVTQTYIDYQ